LFSPLLTVHSLFGILNERGNSKGEEEDEEFIGKAEMKTLGGLFRAL
jgi:hypothetical protein